MTRAHLTQRDNTSATPPVAPPPTDLTHIAWTFVRRSVAPLAPTKTRPPDRLPE
jgi:hypothetical protein